MEKGGESLIPLTEPEIRRLLLSLVWPCLTSVDRVLRWSVWRRRHQAQARCSHYKRRRKLNLRL